MSRIRSLPVIGASSLWERRKSRLQSSAIVARRDLRRSHKGISTGSAACA